MLRSMQTKPHLNFKIGKKVIQDEIAIFIVTTFEKTLEVQRHFIVAEP